MISEHTDYTQEFPAHIEYTQSNLAIYNRKHIFLSHGSGQKFHLSPKQFLSFLSDVWGFSPLRRGKHGFRPDGAFSLAAKHAGHLLMEVKKQTLFWS